MRAMAVVGVRLCILVTLLISTAMVTSAATAPPPAPDCNVPFNDLMPCIDFVNSNTSAAPPPACCTAFAATQKQRPECLCQLQQAFADPATAPGNATRAAEIPLQCKVSVDYSQCASLLGLGPSPSPAFSPLHAPVPAPGPAPRTGKDYDCTNSINELSSCLGFVSGDGKGAPPSDCCAAVANVQTREPVCICQLVAQAADGAQYGINATLAQSLPQLCRVAANTSQCPVLLNSPISPPLSPSLSPSPLPSPSRSPSPSPTSSPSPRPLLDIVPTPAFAPVPAPPDQQSVDCSDEYALLQSCFAYVMANDSAPPSSECCSSFGSVVANRPVCLCQLLQTVGSGDPATTGINATRASELPGVCKVVIDVSTCPALLGQPVAAPVASSPLPGDAIPSVEAPQPSTPSLGSRSVRYSSSIIVVAAAILWSLVL